MLAVLGAIGAVSTRINTPLVPTVVHHLLIRSHLKFVGAFVIDLHLRQHLKASNGPAKVLTVPLVVAVVVGVVAVVVVKVVVLCCAVGCVSVLG